MDRRTFLGALGAVPLAASSRSESAEAACLPLSRAEVGFDPTEQSVDALQRAMSCRLLTAEGLLKAYVRRIEQIDQAGPALHSVLALNDHAQADARALDAEREAGHLRGPLHGIPLLIKDNIETADPMPTTAGSRALARSYAPQDAPLVARLRSAGCIVLGKANLSEWANFRSSHAISGWSGLGGQTRNAYAPARTPSGSSAGSAAGTAASLCTAAIGSETDGSILSPASVNGLVGLKPTVGLVSGRGVIPLSPRQDTAGPIARTVTEAALLASIMAERPLGFGPQGSDLEGFRLKGVRIGALPIPSSAHPETARLYGDARAALEHEGAIIVDLKSPSSLAEFGDLETEAMFYEFKSAINAYLGSLDAGRSPCRSLADLIAFNLGDAVELTAFGQDIFEQAEARGPLSSDIYRKTLARLWQRAVTDGLARLLGAQGVVTLMAPGGGPAALIDTVWGDHGDDGSPPIASAAAVAGYPSLTVPAGLAHDLPIGMVFVGAPDQDGLLLQIGRAYERATNARVPPRFAV